MVGLTELDSKNYQSIMQFKKKLKLQKELFPESPAQEEVPNNNIKIDNFGEPSVKFLQTKPLEFSLDDINNMITSYESGISTPKLAQRFNCSKNTISKILKEHGVKVSNRKAQKGLNADKVISMYEKMYNIEEIAKYFNVSTYAINQCLTEHNIPRRNRWDYPRK